MTPTVDEKKGKCTCCGRAPAPLEGRDPAILPPGTQLDEGSVTVGECLGRGGFGITYIAYDNQENRRIALKEFMPRRMVFPQRDGLDILVQPGFEESYQDALGSFKREARILNVLRNHPNIVKVFFTFDENNTCYYGMEFLEGESLASLLKRRGKPFAPKEIIRLLNPIMDALAFTHSAKILHRDISADNIYLCQDPKNPNKVTPKLIDFGAAYAAIAHFTSQWQNVRKGGYTAIEQLLANTKEQGEWTDVYALSAVIYWLATCQGPTPAEERLRQQIALPMPSQLGIRTDKVFEELLAEGLALNRNDRIQSVRTLQKRFCQLYGEQPCVVFKQPRAMLLDVSDRVSELSQSFDLVEEVDSNGILDGAGALAEQLVFFVGGFLLAGGPVGLLYGAAANMLVNILLCLTKKPGRLNMLLLGLHLTDVSGSKPDFARLMCYCILHAIPVLPLADCVLKLCGRGSFLESGLGLRVVRLLKTKRAGKAKGDGEGGEYPVESGNILGRLEETAQIVVEDPLISRQHCRFDRMSDGRWCVTDLGSRNGTFLEGTRLTAGQAATLSPGQVLRVGEHSFVFQ